MIHLPSSWAGGIPVYTQYIQWCILHFQAQFGTPSPKLNGPKDVPPMAEGVITYTLNIPQNTNPCFVKSCEIHNFRDTLDISDISHISQSIFQIFEANDESNIEKIP